MDKVISGFDNSEAEFYNITVNAEKNITFNCYTAFFGNSVIVNGEILVGAETGIAFYSEDINLRGCIPDERHFHRGASSQVEFGASGSYGQKTKEDTSLNMGHNVIIEDLSPDTTYHFKVTSKDAKGNIAASNDFTYQTPSAQKDKSTLDTIFESFQRVWNSIKGVF